MATVRELRAVFTAEAKGVQRAFQLIRQEAGKLSSENQRTTQEVNSQYASMVQSTQALRTALRETNNVDAFSELTRSSERAQRELRETGNVSTEAMDEMERAIQDASRRFNSLGPEAQNSFRDVGRAIDQVSGQLSGLRDSSAQAEQNLNGLGDSTRLANLENDLQAAQSELDQLRQAAQQADSELGDLGGDNGLDDVSDSANDAGDSLGALGGTGGIVAGVGGAFVAASAGILGFVAAGAGIFAFVKSSDDLQKALNGLQAQTGTANDEMDDMKETMLDIYGNNFGESFEDVANSMALVRQQTNLSDDALGEFTTNALLLRDTFEYDVAESTKAASTLMKNFGIDGQEAMALIADGTQQGLNYADDLLDSIGEYSVYYERAGFSAEEMFGMFKNAQETGAFNIDYAADAFKEFGIIMTEDGDKATDVLSSIGLPAKELQEDFANGGESARAAFQTIAEKLGSIKDPLDQNAAGVELFGTKFEDLGAAAVINIAKTNDSIKGGKEVLDSINEVKYDTIGEALAGVGRKAVTNILIPLQDKVMPGVNGAINGTIGLISNMTESMGQFIRGDESAESVLQTYGLDPDKFKGVIDAMNLIPHALSRIRESFGTVRDAASAVFALFRNQDGTAIELLAGLGLEPQQIQAVMNAVDAVKNAFSGFVSFVGNSVDRMKSLWNSGGSEIFATIKRVFVDSWPTVKEALSAVVSFIGSQIAKILQFWNENGATIMSAVSNIFNGIMAVIQFVMPLVLGIIKSVWGNIKGVISGALDVIMGAVKIFSGLFVGDFGKMWEGLKQVFSGAVTFLWNFIQLTFFGKIIGGLKVFILSFRSFFDDMWRGVIQLFKGGGSSALTTISTAWQSVLRLTRDLFGRFIQFFRDTFATLKSVTGGAIDAVKLIFSRGFSAVRDNTFSVFRRIFDFLKNTFSSIRTSISGSVGNILTKIRDTWSALRTNTFDTFRDIFNGIKSRFTNIVDAAKALPGRIGDGIGSMASKVTAGVTKVINKLASTLGKGVNGVIGGINWVLGKIGVDTDIPKWTVPQYAMGTKGNGAHPGGPMVVGDGKGSNRGPELIETPDGKQMLSPSKPTLTTAPKGTKVWSATETKKILDMIPHYALGDDIKSGLRTAGNWAKDTYNAGKDKVMAAGGAIKDAAVNAFDYIKSPDKFLDLALKTLGIEKPKSGNFIRDMAVGGWNKTKKAAIDYVKNKMKDFGSTQSGISVTGGNGGGFGAPFRLTSKPGPRNTGIPGASRYHKGWDWGAPAGTPIPSVSDGVGWRAGYHPLSGNYVEVKSGNKVHRYQHNTRNMIRVGQKVKKGQTVGTVGSTGVSSGPHLHYELKGYAKGGIINKDQIARVGEGGKKEAIIPLEQHRNRALSLWKQAGDALGVPEQGMSVLYNEQSKVIDALAKILDVGERILNSVIENGMIFFSVKTLLARQAESSSSTSEPAAKTPAKTTASKKTTTITAAQKKAMETKRIAEVKAKQKEVADRARALAAQKKAAAPKASSAEAKYLAAVRKDGDWMNDWATHVPESKRKALFLKGYNLAKSLGHGVGKYGRQHLKRLTGYADGGIVDKAQLAWIAEGGWAESIISHDPAKRVAQKAIWEQTGKELGFDMNNAEVISTLHRIAEAVEMGHGHDIIMSERSVAKAIAPFITKNQELTGKLKNKKI